jgi:hypothetical protein
MDRDQIVTEEEFDFWLQKHEKPIYDKHNVGRAQAFKRGLVHADDLKQKLLVIDGIPPKDTRKL